MATSDSPLNVPNVTLAVARGNSDSAPGQRVISGTGFGSGPNVVLFDSMSAGVNAQPIDLVNSPEIGEWTRDLSGIVSDSIAGVNYYEYAGRMWMAGRDATRLSENSSLRQGLAYKAASPFREFRLAYRTLIPEGYLMPGTTVANTRDNSGSNWKLVWLGSDQSYTGPADVIIPTVWTGNIGSVGVRVEGNSIGPNREDGGGAYAGISAVNENFYSWYQKPGTERLNNTGYMELLSEIRSVYPNANVFADGAGSEPIPAYEYQSVMFNAWWGNVPTWVNVFTLFADMYLAVGENSCACIITGSSSTLDASTEKYLIPPDSWTDGEIRFTPRPKENLPYTHLILADGTLINNVTGV